MLWQLVFFATLAVGSRRKLSQLNIHHTLEKRPSGKITTEEFYKLATQILLWNDFNQTYPGKENKLFSTLSAKQEDILAYAKGKAAHSRNNTFRTEILKLIGMISGVLGRTTFYVDIRPDDPFDKINHKIASELCTSAHHEDKKSEVKSAITNFQKRVSELIDTHNIESDIQQATVSQNYDVLINKYCSKAPQLKEYAKDLLDGMAPCLSADSVSQGKKSVNTVVDFLCESKGARVAYFFKEGGPQCVQEKKHDLLSCEQGIQFEEARFSSGTRGGFFTATTVKERCTFVEKSLTCFANALRECSNPIPGNLVQEFHDVYVNSLCSEAKENTHLPVDARNGETPQSAQPCSEANNEVELLKKTKLELEVRTAKLEMWNRENQLQVEHTDLTSDIKPRH